MHEPRIRFLIGGVQKGGTSALASALAMHPALALPDGKEAHVFDAPDFDEGWSTREVDARFAPYFQDVDPARMHGDATPVYLYHPRLVARIARYNPGMRWIVLLRDPVERAISHYFMERARGVERRTLLGAVLGETARLRGSRDDFSLDSAWRWASYADRSRYADQLDVLAAHFPKEQCLLLRSADLAAAPEEAARRAFEFLGVPASVPATVGRVFQGRYRMPSAASPGLWLLRWRLRHERQRLQARHGFSL